MASCSQPPPPPPDPAIPTISSQPSDIELAKLLRALVDPRASPPGNSITIHDADVYAHDPADLTRHLAGTVADDGQKAWYFSTELLPKSQQGGKRKRRCMDSGGVWRDEGKSKPVVGSQARRYLFAFLNKDGARTGWIMHELRLPVPDGNEESPVVLCKVFRSSRRNPAISAATAEAQAQAEVEVVVEKEAVVKAVEAREAAVKVREEALLAREAAVEATEALVRMDAPEMAVERNLQERQSNLAVLQETLAALQAREAAETRNSWASRPYLAALFLQSLALAQLRRLGQLMAEWEREAQMMREAQLMREAEVEGLARREAALLAAWERDLQERERNLTAREAAFRSRQQEIFEELAAELEALVLILMAAIMMVARAGLLWPIAGGSSAAAVAHCGGALEPLF